MTNKITSVISYIVIMFITIFIASYAISFLVQKSEKPAVCDREHIYLCNTKDMCQKQDFYWWDNSCHFTELLVCSKEYIHLCDTEILCKEINLYWWDNSCHTNEKPKPKPSEYPDYDSLKDLNSLLLIENKISWSPEAKPENIIGYQKQLRSTGQFARIYFYAEVSVNNKPLTQYESLYVKFNNTGGHLFRPQSLKIPADTITHLLYAINNVPYLSSIPYSESKTPLTTNWFNFFKYDSLITANIFISSLKPATINKIILYYDCVEDSDCKIEIK